MDEPTIQQRVLAEVVAERQRQDEQWGVFRLLASSGAIPGTASSRVPEFDHECPG
jgi:hypothetical protein